MRNKNPITRNGVRIFRPDECKRFIAAIPKPEYRTMFQALLYSGMRYVEMKRLWKHPNWFDGEFINLPREAVFKQKRSQLERSVTLNPQGRMAIEFYLRNKKCQLPSWQGWHENLTRWAENAHLDPIGMSAKTTRKTWESWLVFYYPNRIANIVLSQGHILVTSLQHYLNMPFNSEDKLLMREFVQGWIDE